MSDNILQDIDGDPIPFSRPFVEQVTAGAGPKQLLKQVVFFIGQTRRSEAGNSCAFGLLHLCGDSGQRFVPIGGALFLAILLAIGLWFFLRKRKEKIATLTPPDLRSPAQRAKENLLAIRDARIWQSGDVKGYYSQVSDTARTYLEEEFRVAAMEMISDELLDAMQSKISANAQGVLRNMLRTADMVKFAKAKPGPDQHGQLWDDAMKLIDLTEPKTPDHAE